MESNIKGVLLFLLGAGCGAIVTNQLLKDKYELMAEEAKAVLEEDYANRQENMAIVETEGHERPTVFQHPFIRNVADEDGVKKDAREILKPYRDYNNKIEPGKIIEERPEEEKQQTSDQNVFVIPVESFTNDYRHYDKLSIRYYDVDSTLADENDDIIDDPVGAVGESALSRFGDGSKDPDIVYVRNDKLGTDFEVVRIYKSYKETVMGVVEAKEKLRRKKVRNEDKEERPPRE